MPDVYAMITEVDPGLQEELASVLELRAADPAQRAMLAGYTAALDLPGGAAVLEVGCGTGPVCRHLATLPGVASVTGVDPSPLFVERARALAPGLDFRIGDARALEFPDDAFDAVVFHTSLCHVPDVERGARGGPARAAPGRPGRGVRRRLRDDHVRSRRRRSAAELRGGGDRHGRARPVADAADRAARRRGRLHRRPGPRPRVHVRRRRDRLPPGPGRSWRRRAGHRAARSARRSRTR